MTETWVARRLSARYIGDCHLCFPPLRGLEERLAARVRYTLGLGGLRCEDRSRRLPPLRRLRRVPVGSNGYQRIIYGPTIW